MTFLLGYNITINYIMSMYECGCSVLTCKKREKPKCADSIPTAVVPYFFLLHKNKQNIFKKI